MSSRTILMSALALAVVLAVVLGVPAEGQAQRPGPGAPTAATVPMLSAEQRAAQLRAVVGLVTTPDRELNIANFEQIMETGDVRRIELAVRSLIAGEDPVLRGMAMRGYIAVTREIELEVVLPPDQLRVVEEARAQGTYGRMAQGYAFLPQLAQIQFRVKLWFEPASLRDIRGIVRSLPIASNDRDFQTSYVVRGDRITFRLWPAPSLAISCDFELEPGRDAAINATMRCIGGNFSRPVQLIGQMF